jgi:hypothetical protein
MGLDVKVDYECQRCHLHTASSVGLALLDDAEVVSFYRDHGVDLNEVPYWTLEWCVTDRHTTVESEEPWRLRVEVSLDGETLVARLDGDLAVVDKERRTLEVDALDRRRPSARPAHGWPPRPGGDSPRSGPTGPTSDGEAGGWRRTRWSDSRCWPSSPWWWSPRATPSCSR